MTNARDLRTGLESLGLDSGDVVLVHSALSGMACEPETLLDAFLDVLGDDGTLVVPTFTPTFRHESPDGVFDVEETPSEVGYFTELVRTHPDSTRNVYPTHSFAALGGRAEEFGRAHARNTYDRNNVLGRLHEEDALIVALGLEHFGRSMTFFHYVEYQEGVGRRGWDFRHEKSYPGTVVVNGKAMDAEYAIHAQNFEKGVTYDFRPLGELLEREGVTRTARMVDREFVAVRATDAYDHVARAIVEEPELVYDAGGE